MRFASYFSVLLVLLVLVTYAPPAEAASRWWCPSGIEQVYNSWLELLRNRRLKASADNTSVTPADVVAVRARAEAGRTYYGHLALHALNNPALSAELAKTFAWDSADPATQQALGIIFLSAIQEPVDLKRMSAGGLFIGTAQAAIRFLADNVHTPYSELGINLDEAIARRRIRGLIASTLIANNLYQRESNYSQLVSFLASADAEGVAIAQAVRETSPDIFTWGGQGEDELLTTFFSMMNDLVPGARAVIVEQLQRRLPRNLLIRAVGLVHRLLLEEQDPVAWSREIVVYTDLIQRVTTVDMKATFAASEQYRQITGAHFDVRSPIVREFCAIVFLSYRGPESEHPMVTIYARQLLSIKIALDSVKP